jgi:tRNA pseudouridine55 synthase
VRHGGSPEEKHLEQLSVDLSVRCSSGTYVRAIARDLGEELAVGGHLTMLRRTAVGPFTLAEARPLSALEDSFDMLDISEVARRCFPSHPLEPQQAEHVRYGRALDLRLDEPGPAALFDESGTFLALYEQRGEAAAPVAVFV